MAQHTPIQTGEMFIRLEGINVVWKVIKVVDLPGLPQHLELRSSKSRRHRITLSEFALRDRSMWISLTSFNA